MLFPDRFGIADARGRDGRVIPGDRVVFFRQFDLFVETDPPRIFIQCREEGVLDRLGRGESHRFRGMSGAEPGVFPGGPEGVFRVRFFGEGQGREPAVGQKPQDETVRGADRDMGELRTVESHLGLLFLFVPQVRIIGVDVDQDLFQPVEHFFPPKISEKPC